MPEHRIGTREEWPVTGALIAARNRGWMPCRALVVQARIMADPEGTPRDVLVAARPGPAPPHPARPP
jgi:hypothetical protein